MEASESITVNVGVLGHVDSGKTSICAALSQVLGTAALDRNPQSQERGITLDLQFSALNVERDGKPIRVCLVDCPGHASLLRTIVGGAHIIDVAMLVVDVTKGIQTQTAEWFVYKRFSSFVPSLFYSFLRFSLYNTNVVISVWWWR